MDVGRIFNPTQSNPLTYRPDLTQPMKLTQGPNPTNPLGAHMQKWRYVATKYNIQITVSSSVIIVPNQQHENHSAQITMCLLFLWHSTL